MFQIRHLDHLVLRVTDLQATMRFYIDVLGLEVRSDTQLGTDMRWVMVEAVATNVANISFNLAMLKGLWGLPRPSVATVAGATVVSMAFGMLFMTGDPAEVISWLACVRGK